MIKTVTQLREAFWAAHPQFQSEFRKTWRQNKYNTDIRVSWVFFVDSECKNGNISTSLSNRAIL